MEKENQQKVLEFLDKSKKILIALPQLPNPDGLGSALALAEFLKEKSKEVDVFCADWSQQEYGFLPGSEQIKKAVALPKSFVVIVSTAKAKIDEISYSPKPDAVEILIKPKDGEFSSSDVSFRNDNLYDLIISIDAPSLEQLGSLYSENAEAFFNAAKLNIDNHVNNENYANINLVDVTASSTSEVVLSLLKAAGQKISPEMATNLLAGVIYETNSFQNPRTSPNSFALASELVNLGANQQEIIRYLFKTKELPVLKLWGRAMARLGAAPEQGVFYSMLNAQDLEKSGARQDDLKKVMQEFALNISDLRLIVLAVEQGSGIDLYFESNPNIKISEIINHFGGEMLGASDGKAHVANVKISDSADFILENIKNLKVRLGL